MSLGHDSLISMHNMHLTGVFFGLGGALMSDVIFFKAIRDESLSAKEIRIMKWLSRIVWFGFAILLISGIGIVSGNPEKYLNSSKFWAKQTVVSILVLNGLIFHKFHIPRMLRHANHHFPSSDEFMRSRFFLIVSGAVSLTSWLFAFILGMLSNLQYSYVEFILGYLTILFVAIFVGFFRRKKILPHHHKGY